MRGVPVGRLGWLGIGLLLLLCYANGLHAPFVYDDKVEVIGNQPIRMLENWRAILGYNVSRPLLVFTYAWNFDMWRYDPFGYHVFSVAVHVLTVGAAIAMAEAIGRLGGHPRPLVPALLAVAVWAVHPMGTESVTYITGRSESMCALFVFAGLAAWATALLRERAIPQSAWAGGVFRGLGIVAFCCAILTKEVGAVWPVAALLLEFGFGRSPKARGLGLGWRERLGQVRWRWYLLCGGLWVAAGWARMLHAGTLLPREVDRALPIQMVTSAEVWLRYVGLWLVPVRQTIFHHVDDISPLSVRGLSVVAGWCTMVAAAVWWGRRRPLAGWALATGALFLLPSTSVVPLKENMAEHRAYQLGLYLFLALGWSVSGRWARRASWTSVLALAPLVLATIARNRVWSSEVAVWTEATEIRPEVADAWYGLGDAYRFADQFDAAVTAYERATELEPDNLDAWNNIGIVRAEMGDLNGARETWLKVLRKAPDYCKAHNNLGFLAIQRGHWEDAITELRTTLSYCPNDPLAHFGLGNIYYGPARRDSERAVRHYEALLRENSGFVRAEEVKQRLLELTW